MKLTFSMNLAKQTQNLFFFMGEVHRLCNENRNFIFGFKGGNKLYLETCKGLQKKAYACILDRDVLESTIATLNYAIALQANLQLSLDHLVLNIEITSKHIDKIKSFADSLDVEYKEIL